MASVFPAPQAEIVHEASPSLASEIAEFWRQFFVAAFQPYRPERHYMRGPGPAWRAKHGDAPPGG